MTVGGYVGGSKSRDLTVVATYSGRPATDPGPFVSVRLKPGVKREHRETHEVPTRFASPPTATPSTKPRTARQLAADAVVFATPARPAALPRPRHDPAVVAIVIEMYAAGASQTKIGVRLGKSQNWVSLLMRYNGITTRPWRPGA